MKQPTKAVVQQRVEEILRIRLDGAEMWDVREYVREKEKETGSLWELAEGIKPLSDATLWRYIARADRLIAESCRASRKKLLRRHLAQRRNLYAKAVAMGDVRAALSVLQDEAELQGLYPAKKLDHRGKDGGPINLKVETLTDDQRTAALERIISRFGLPASGNGSAAPDRNGTGNGTG